MSSVAVDARDSEVRRVLGRKGVKVRREDCVVEVVPGRDLSGAVVWDGVVVPVLSVVSEKVARRVRAETERWWWVVPEVPCGDQ